MKFATITTSIKSRHLSNSLRQKHLFEHSRQRYYDQKRQFNSYCKLLFQLLCIFLFVELFSRNQSHTFLKFATIAIKSTTKKLWNILQILCDHINCSIFFKTLKEFTLLVNQSIKALRDRKVSIVSNKTSFASFKKIVSRSQLNF